MNIQFMTEENARINKNGETIYIPNYEALIENACCEEEIEAIKECMKDNFGFAFRIVFTIYTECLDYNRETHKQEWKKQWTIYQHPWYIKNGERVEKSEMIAKIANEHSKAS